MVKRNTDGSLRVIGRLSGPGWLAEHRVEEAVAAREQALGRALTDEEVAEVRAEFAE